MIAEAVKAAVPDADRVAVDLATIRWTDRAKSRRYIYLTPRAAQEALLDFDAGKKSDPLTFSLQGAMIVAARGEARTKRMPQTEPTTKTKMVQNSGGKRTPPVRVGGKGAPVGVLSNMPLGPKTNRRGRRREFGLRQATP
jgi:hypothetical protein